MPAAAARQDHGRGWKVPGAEAQAVEGRADTVADAAMGRDLSQISHELTGRHRTIASVPDTEQDADVRIRIPAHWPDTFH
jgi:hypothetical protein